MQRGLVAKTKPKLKRYGQGRSSAAMIAKCLLSSIALHSSCPPRYHHGDSRSFYGHGATDCHRDCYTNQPILNSPAPTQSSTSFSSCVSLCGSPTSNGLYAPSTTYRSTASYVWTTWHTCFACCCSPLYSYCSRMLLGLQVLTSDAAAIGQREFDFDATQK